MEEMIELTNGKKIITRTKEQYEANIKTFELRGFKPVQNNLKENIKEVDKTYENETKVVQLKPKKKKKKVVKK